MSASKSGELPINERLNRLEQENRSLKCLFRATLAGIGILIAALIMLGAAQSHDGAFDTITCKHFVFQDEAGRKRIEMKADPDGQVGQNFFDVNGNGRILLVVLPNGDVEQTFSDRHGWRIGTVVTYAGDAVQMFRDRSLRTREVITTTSDGGVSHDFRDASGEVIMVLPLPVD